MKYTVLFTLIICFSSITNGIYSQNNSEKYDSDIETVLLKAGENRKELESFLDKYKMSGDTMKMKAACFLVRNMDIHYSEVFYWQDSLKNVVVFNEMDYPDYSHALKAFKELSAKGLKPVISKKYDIEYVKAGFLTNNLETAFKIWQNPQSKHLNFEEFCEYILPYRNATETLEEWRDLFAKTFAPSNTASLNRSVKESANLLNDVLTGYFVSSYSYEDKNNPVSFLSPSQLLFRKRGHCEDMVNLTQLAFKSQGIPCRIDLVPYHGTSTGRHYWNATIDENHKILPFEGSKNSIEDFYLKREPAKVISYTYSKQPNVIAARLPIDQIPPNFLRNHNYKDVTELYWETMDLTCQLKYKPKNSIAYVAVMNGLNWRPVYWGEVDSDNNAHFSNMGCGVAYLPMVFEKNKLMPAGYPVLVAENKETKILEPDFEDTHTITLKEQDRYLKYRIGKQYSLYYWNDKWTLLNKKKATNKPELIFENVPKNALLLLIPEYSQKKERPFYITSTGERMWW